MDEEYPESESRKSEHCGALAASLTGHRVSARDLQSVCVGRVRYSPVKSVWLLGMLTAAVVGGALNFSWAGVALFLRSTATVG
jgi:stearoyl-CoA desaturase (delta-9 desaturase)